MAPALKYSHPIVYAHAVPSTEKFLDEFRNNVTCRFRVSVIFFWYVHQQNESKVEFRVLIIDFFLIGPIYC